MKLSIHKQHRIFLFNYRLVSEVELPLSRLLTETNAVFEVPFEYKNGIKLIVDLDMRTHEAPNNQISIKLLGIQKTYPPIRFISDKPIPGGSSSSRSANLLFQFILFGKLFLFMKRADQWVLNWNILDY